MSCWKYLRYRIKSPGYLFKMRSFSSFLRDLPYLWKTKYNRLNATHTAPIWGDITDSIGILLVDEIIKLKK